jgi:CheY-like chemotaxis protein
MQTPDVSSSSIVQLARKSRPVARKPSPKFPYDDAPNLDLRGMKVLVIDDPEHSEQLKEVLGTEGCDVRTARTASDAIGVLTTFTPHAVILELALPGMSGVLFTRVLKADPATRDLVIVALSAMNGPAVERIAKEAGCRAYLRKPIAAAVIVRTLAHYLEDRR